MRTVVRVGSAVRAGTEEATRLRDNGREEIWTRRSRRFRDRYKDGKGWSVKVCDVEGSE